MPICHTPVLRVVGLGKVIIHTSRDEVSLVEQDIIDYGSAVEMNSKKIFLPYKKDMFYSNF